jgi:hypothetical protein
MAQSFLIKRVAVQESRATTNKAFDTDHIPAAHGRSFERSPTILKSSRSSAEFVMHPPNQCVKACVKYQRMSLEKLAWLYTFGQTLGAQFEQLHAAGCGDGRRGQPRRTLEVAGLSLHDQVRMTA